MIYQRLRSTYLVEHLRITASKKQCFYRRFFVTLVKFLQKGINKSNKMSGSQKYKKDSFTRKNKNRGTNASMQKCQLM